jgi:ribosomal protein S18 acetylase RimI-like enzyme
MISIEPLGETPEDFEFAFEVKKAAMGPHIRVKWGWDEEFQRKFHAERWRAKHFHRIVLDGKAIGTVAIDVHPTHVQFGEFYLLPEYQNRGLGSAVVDLVIRDLAARKLPLRLECLKWNPAVGLYRRKGFVITRETDIHYFMERPSTVSQRDSAS